MSGFETSRSDLKKFRALSVICTAAFRGINTFRVRFGLDFVASTDDAIALESKGDDLVLLWWRRDSGVVKPVAIGRPTKRSIEYDPKSCRIRRRRINSSAIGCFEALVIACMICMEWMTCRTFVLPPICISSLLCNNKK
jgi:hypothetical protein